MDEYISKGNAIFAVSALPLTLDAETTQRAIEAVRHVPAADVEEVVRCKDCRFLGIKDFVYGHCEFGGGMGGIVMPDSYCSKGQRKESKKDDRVGCY